MLKNIVKEYINENRKIVVSLFVCVLVGVISGLMVYNFSDKDIKDILVSQMAQSIKASSEGEIIKIGVLYNGMKNNIILVFFMFLFSIMLYGTLLIYLLYIIKGTAIGIYIGTLFGVFGFWWGILAILVLVVLVNIVFLPAMIYIGSTFVNYNLNVLEYKNEIGKVDSISKVFLKVCFAMIIIFSSVIFEQMLSNIAVKIYNYIA